jgi:hypothetical protein
LCEVHGKDVALRGFNMLELDVRLDERKLSFGASDVKLPKPLTKPL